MANIFINNGGIVTNKDDMPSIDFRYGPYDSLSVAHAALSADGLCAIGLTVGIINDNKVEEYWYQEGTELSNLVKKQSNAYTKQESDAKYQPKGNYQPAGNYATKTELNGKVDNVPGKGLSTNDYTNEDKAKVAAAITEHQDISGKADKSEVTAEQNRATTAEENLRTLYNNLQQSQPIPVTTLPAQGEAGKIYRLAGTNSYADYMYSENDLTTPIKMAEYDNADNNEAIECIKGFLLNDINAVENYSWQGAEQLNDTHFIYKDGCIVGLEKVPVSGGETIVWNCGLANAPFECVLVLFNSVGEIIEWYAANAESRTIELPQNCTHIQCSFVKGAKNMGVFHTDGTAIFVPKTTDEDVDYNAVSNIFEGFGYNGNGDLVENADSVATAHPIPVSGSKTLVWGCGESQQSLQTKCCLVGFSSEGTFTEYWISDSISRTITLDANTRFIVASFKSDFNAKGLFTDKGDVIFIPHTEGALEQIRKTDVKCFSSAEPNVYINNGWDMYGNLSKISGVCCTKTPIPISGITNIIWNCGNNTPNHNTAILIFYDSSGNILEWYSSYLNVRRILVPTGAVSFNASFKMNFQHAYVATASGDILFKPVMPSLQQQLYDTEDNDVVIEQEKIKQFSAIIGGATGEIESFMLFSDPHWYQNYDNVDITSAAQQIMKRMFKYWQNAPVDFAVGLGDWLTDHKKSVAINALAEINTLMRRGFDGHYYPAFGNHDNNYQGEEDTTSDKSANDGVLTNQQMTNLMFREWGKMYYTFKGSNTRFYTFDSGIDWSTAMDAYKWEQIDWFANSLLHENDEHIVILLHIVENTAPTPEQFLTNVIPLAENISLVAQAFNQRTGVNMNGISYDFSQKLGTVHCIICGHTHYDAVGELHSIPVYNITCCISNDAFDLVLLDYGTKKLRSVRLGIGNNRAMNIL